MLVIVTERKSQTLPLLHRLQSHGIFALAVTYGEAEQTVWEWDTGGVLLDGVGELRRAEECANQLAACYPQMPIGALVAANAVPDLPISRIIRQSPDHAWIDDVLDFCIRDCGWTSSVMSTATLYVTDIPEETLYMGYRLKLSLREHLILRCLFYRSPRLTSTHQLMVLCYPEGTQNAKNLSVQIARINRAAKSIDPRPLIVNQYGAGYRLRDGIVPPKTFLSVRDYFKKGVPL